MNLAELLAQPKAKTLQCKWRQWWITLNELERSTIQAAFDNLELETSHVVRALQAYGCPSSPTTIRTHRRGECKTCS